MVKIRFITLFLICMLILVVASCGSDNQDETIPQGAACETAIPVSAGDPISGLVEGDASVYYQLSLGGATSVRIDVTENAAAVAVTLDPSLSGQYTELSEGGFFFENPAAVCLVAAAINKTNTGNLPFTFIVTVTDELQGSTPELAITLANAEPASGTLTANDTVYYKLEAIQGQRLEFTSDGTGSLCVVEPQLYSSVAANQDFEITPLTWDQSEQSLLCTYTIAANGTYYLAIGAAPECAGEIAYSFMIQTVTPSAKLLPGATESQSAPTVNKSETVYDNLSDSGVAWYKFAGVSGRTVNLNLTYNHTPGLELEFYADPEAAPVLQFSADSSAAGLGVYHISLNQNYYIKLIYSTTGPNRRFEFYFTLTGTPVGRSPAQAQSFNPNCPRCMPGRFFAAGEKYFWLLADDVAAGKYFSMSAYNRSASGTVKVSVFDNKEAAVLYFDFLDNEDYRELPIMHLEAAADKLEVLSLKIAQTDDYYILIQAAEVEDYEVVFDVIYPSGAGTAAGAVMLKSRHVYLTTFSQSNPKWFKFEDIESGARIRLVHYDNGFSQKVITAYDEVEPSLHELQIEPIAGTVNRYLWDWEDYTTHRNMWLKFAGPDSSDTTIVFAVYIEYP